MARGIGGVLLALVYLSASAQQPQSVLHVGNDGIDSDTCGDRMDKCRSISKAVRNARSLDTILVDLGVYGDLNHNGIIGEPGEEFGGYIGGPQEQDGLIFVDKALTILSERGAALTILDAGETGLSGVIIGASNVVFGWTGMGFTVRTKPLQFYGNYGIRARDYASEVTIAGNRVIGSNHGIWAPQADIYDNEVIASATTGIWGGRRIDGNVVWGALVGISPHSLIAGGPVVVEGNVVLNNSRVGFEIFGTLQGDPNDPIITVTGNDILQNGGPGILTRTATAVIQYNNIIGNDREPNLPNMVSGIGCGLVNASDGYLWAAENYWGPQGDVDRACNLGTGITVTDPTR
jgi:hypothetical protein